MRSFLWSSQRCEKNRRLLSNKMLTRVINRLQLFKSFGSGVFKLSQANVSGEAQLVKLLQQRFPQAKTLQVQDISGGCGAMYEISIEAPEFRGLNTVKQHRLVTETLKAQIKEMHGLRIHTAATD